MGTSYPTLDSNMANLSNHEFSLSSTHKAASRSVAEPRPFTDAPNSNLCQTLNRRPHVPKIDACEHSGVGVRLLIITSRQLVAFEAGLWAGVVPLCWRDGVSYGGIPCSSPRSKNNDFFQLEGPIWFPNPNR